MHHQNSYATFDIHNHNSIQEKHHLHQQKYNTDPYLPQYNLHWVEDLFQYMVRFVLPLKQ
jgi:hypothetical protein